MKQLSMSLADGDFRQWPLAQDTACQIVRVSFQRGQEAIVKKFKELHVRSAIVKQMAKIYIQNRIKDLGERPEVLKLSVPAVGSVQERFEKHIDERVDAEYPLADFGRAEGKVAKPREAHAVSDHPGVRMKMRLLDGPDGLL